MDNPRVKVAEILSNSTIDPYDFWIIYQFIREGVNPEDPSTWPTSISQDALDDMQALTVPEIVVPRLVEICRQRINRYMHGMATFGMVSFLQIAAFRTRTKHLRLTITSPTKVKRAGVWLPQNVIAQMLGSLERAKRALAGAPSEVRITVYNKIQPHFAPDVVRRVISRPRIELQNGNFTPEEIAMALGQSVDWVLLYINEELAACLEDSNEVVYPLEELCRLKKIAEDCPGEWFSVNRICRVVGCTPDWVQRHLSLGLAQNTLIRGKATTTYPTAEVMRLKRLRQNA